MQGNLFGRICSLDLARLFCKRCVTHRPVMAAVMPMGPKWEGVMIWGEGRGQAELARVLLGCWLLVAWLV